MCPWNERFATALPDESPYAARPALAGKEPRSLAHELLAMSEESFRQAFAGSPMKRAKLRGLKRNAAVLLGNLGTDADRDALEIARSDDEPLAREHIEWALAQIAARRCRAPAP